MKKIAILVLTVFALAACKPDNWFPESFNPGTSTNTGSGSNSGNNSGSNSGSNNGSNSGSNNNSGSDSGSNTGSGSSLVFSEQEMMKWLTSDVWSIDEEAEGIDLFNYNIQITKDGKMYITKADFGSEYQTGTVKFSSYKKTDSYESIHAVFTYTRYTYYYEEVGYQKWEVVPRVYYDQTEEYDFKFTKAGGKDVLYTQLGSFKQFVTGGVLDYSTDPYAKEYAK